MFRTVLNTKKYINYDIHENIPWRKLMHIWVQNLKTNQIYWAPPPKNDDRLALGVDIFLPTISMLFKEYERKNQECIGERKETGGRTFGQGRGLVGPGTSKCRMSGTVQILSGVQLLFS